MIQTHQDLLREWINHSDASYHDFDPKEAREIRTALVRWYRSNRRKLPWRGDPPPYDGSTVGFVSPSTATKTKDKKRRTKKADNDDGGQKQQNITQYFTTSKSTRSRPNQPFSAKNNEANNNEQEEEEDTAASNQEIEVQPVSAYGVWVSEIMLQQTRVEAVIPYYLKWMKSFPTVKDLAEATPDQVNAHWAGLGFYRRARLLHEGARQVVDKHNHELPRTVEGLLKIPGIGPYTAAAIASIAYDQPVAVVDGNVCRVLSRLTGIANHIKAPILKDKLGWKLAQQLIDAGNTNNNDDDFHPGEVNQALMELGATYCAPSGTGLHPDDPLKDYYRSTKLAASYIALRQQRQQLFSNNTTENNESDGDDDLSLQRILFDNEFDESVKSCCTCPLCDNDEGISQILSEWQQMFKDNANEPSHGPFPLPPPKTSRQAQVLAVAALCSTDDKWLLVRRPSKGLLAHQWEFPATILSSQKVAAAAKTNKTKSTTMTKEGRSDALNELLKELTTTDKKDKKASPLCFDYDNGLGLHEVKRTRLQEPVEHIFSHITHTMWIETKQNISMDDALLAWKSSSGRQVQWMSVDDMDQVGVTSQVKKILKAVQTSTKSKATKQTSQRIRKRQRKT